MFANVYGETTRGIEGVKINVEVDVSNGLPAFDIVGLPTMSVREARERVKSALRNSDYPFPMTHITVNLAPADLKKDGSGLDVPIAVGILVSSKFLSQEMTEGKIFVGELSLDGKVRKVNGVLSMIIEAQRNGFKEIFIPEENAAEGKLVTGIDVYTHSNLRELIEHLQGKIKLQPLPKENILQNLDRAYDVDFADVKGQPVARRALEIAAAGGHSILMMGAPGCGKTMLARRLVTILPPVTEAEALEITKIYSIVNMLPQTESVMIERPFRSPHHSVSASALLGGGTYPMPG
ncbi:MAG: ATP-binding protein, partial [Phascolarctobacterium sp.]|nr:ATP-binding protein [Phascolarctobacterium sp.]